MPISRLTLILLLLLAVPLRAQRPEPATVRVSVLSLFHPTVLTLRTSTPITLDRTTNLPANASIAITLTPENRLQLTLPTRTFTTPILQTAPGVLTLIVPAKLARTYRGSLTFTAHDGALHPILTLPTELAVASIVQAESPPHAHPEYLKAQAIAARSFLLANLHAHPDADACDTTHCQFLRSPPPPGSPAYQATAATAGLVLTWQPDPARSPRIVRAMYSRSCGGHTNAHPSADPGDYPFFPVRCAYCLRHPETWSRPAPPYPLTTEQARTAWNRMHRNGEIPSLTLNASNATFSGRGNGHGVGLCQLGAADLAANGQTYRQILAHFYPATTLTRLPRSPSPALP